MLTYYLELSFRSFRRDKLLTALMILALGLGIGASMTMLSLLNILSGDPIPQKSNRIFTVTLDPTPADDKIESTNMPRWWGNLMTYTDAMNLLRADKGEHQAVVALTKAKTVPSNHSQRPFYSDGVITTSSFFSMFDAPFEYGGAWSNHDDDTRARVAVIGNKLNQRIFAGANSVGRTILFNGAQYRVIGVLKHWSPQPRFYAISLGGSVYGDGDMVFLPIDTATADGMKVENLSCWASGDFQHLETAPCVWVSFWVELDGAAKVRDFKYFLSNYVQNQISLGRISHQKSWLYSLKDFLDWQQIVPDDIRSQTGLAFGFLLVCIINTVGLLLAKCLHRSKEVGVRRALGATRNSIFYQFMVESGTIGAAGGVLGLIFAEIGLAAIRRLPTQYAHLAHIDVVMVGVTFALALFASLMSGVFPAWRACSVEPVPQLKAG